MVKKKWEIISNLKFTINNLQLNPSKRIQEIITTLLENRGLKTEKEIEEFLNPKLETVTVQNVGIDKEQLEIAINRIKKAIETKEQIVVYGDYDADGITGTAVLWEALFSLGANVLPYIPHRIEEGYGLSEKGILNLKGKISDIKLIITVDNGIVASKGVEFAKENGIDIIITDHHLTSDKLPKALAIVHSTKLCGAGVGWLLTQEIKKTVIPAKAGIQENSGSQIKSGMTSNIQGLDLVALGTIADLVPLTNFNRTLVKFGLRALQTTKRVGLLALFKEAGVEQEVIDVYQVGHMICPRINAMGRLESAMDSLRLLCTRDFTKGKLLAEKLGFTNKERQLLTKDTALHAVTSVREREGKLKNLLFIVDETYTQGIIGLVAGRLVEEFYRPSIVISKGEKYSKASARSIKGFNIIEFIRQAEEFLVDCGGHPMAAGFTVETEKLELLQERLEKLAEDLLNEDHFITSLRVDLELPLDLVSIELYQAIQQLAPFGMGNPEPTFVSKDVEVKEIRTVGMDGKHLKMQFIIPNSKFMIHGIGFGLGEKAKEVKIGDKIDIVYTIDENIWNGNKNLQLKMKDIKK